MGSKRTFNSAATPGSATGTPACICALIKIHQRPNGGGAAFVFCDEVDDYCQEIKKNGAIVKMEPADQPYGMRDFIVLDPDGNHLTFGCELRKAGVADQA